MRAITPTINAYEPINMVEAKKNGFENTILTATLYINTFMLDELKALEIGSVEEIEKEYDPDEEVTFILPDIKYMSPEWNEWIKKMIEAESHYKFYRSSGMPHKEVKSMLTGHLMTEARMIANLDEWKYLANHKALKMSHELSVAITDFYANVIQHYPELG